MMPTDKSTTLCRKFWEQSIISCDYKWALYDASCHLCIQPIVPIATPMDSHQQLEKGKADKHVGPKFNITFGESTEEIKLWELSREEFNLH